MPNTKININATIASNTTHIESCKETLYRIEEKFQNLTEIKDIPQPFSDDYTSYETGGITYENDPEQINLYGNIEDQTGADLCYTVLKKSIEEIETKEIKKNKITQRIITLGEGF